MKGLCYGKKCAGVRTDDRKRLKDKGNAYANALAETRNGRFQNKVIYRKGPWRSEEIFGICGTGMGRWVQ